MWFILGLLGTLSIIRFNRITLSYIGKVILVLIGLCGGAITFCIGFSFFIENIIPKVFELKIKCLYLGLVKRIHKVRTIMPVYKLKITMDLEVECSTLIDPNIMSTIITDHFKHHEDIEDVNNVLTRDYLTVVGVEIENVEIH